MQKKYHGWKWPRISLGGGGEKGEEKKKKSRKRIDKGKKASKL
jgi:hypothetical protein